MTLAWGFTQEAPNEILILANDLEQTLARVFRTMEGIIQHNPELQREGRAPIFACTVTSGLRLKKSSLPAKCGTRASIRRIIRRSSAATRSISVATRALSTTTRARVAVKCEIREKLILVSHRIWKPTPNQPYQMHRSITTLQAAGVPIKEYAQTQANCTLMGQTLFDLLTGAKSRSVPFRRTEAAGALDRGR